tara:strand:+ start:1550 stop:2041 length:492 start_codon:yes stop_codon:yes gene_type:complete
MYNLVSNQLTLMTTNFCHTTLPWKQRSTSIGISCFAFIMPGLAITTVGSTQTILKILFPSQSVIALASDWYWSGEKHWSHGVDKWHASSFLLLMIFLSGKNIHILYPVLVLYPLYNWWYAREAVKEYNWNNYVYYHSMWHWSGCSICTMATYLIYNDNSPLIQ